MEKKGIAPFVTHQKEKRIETNRWLRELRERWNGKGIEVAVYYRKMNTYLRKKNVEFYKFALKPEKLLNVVQKGITHKVNEGAVKV